MLAKCGWRSVKSAAKSRSTTRLFSMSQHSSGSLFTQRYNQVKDGVFQVSNISGTKTGTGFTVQENGNGFTCAHVFDWLPGGQHRDAHCMLTFEDGFKCPGIAHHFDDDLDLAICRPAFVPDEKIFKPLMIGNAEDVEVGNEIFVLGFPRAKLSMSIGSVSDISDRFLGPDTPQPYSTGKIIRSFSFCAALSRGHAGGPLFNDKGHVIGIISNISYQKELVERPFPHPPEILIPKNLGVALALSEIVKELN